MTGTHTPAKEVFVGAAQRSCTFPSALLCSWASPSTDLCEQGDLAPQTGLSPWTLSSGWSASLGTSGQNTLSPRPNLLRNTVLLSFHFVLKSRSEKNCKVPTQPGQAKPIKCSFLSACFNFPERLLNAFLFLPCACCINACGRFECVIPKRLLKYKFWDYLSLPLFNFLTQHWVTTVLTSAQWGAVGASPLLGSFLPKSPPFNTKLHHNSCSLKHFSPNNWSLKKIICTTKEHRAPSLVFKLSWIKRKVSHTVIPADLGNDIWLECS